ncbi:MAG: glycosyltransferase family 2 protein [Chloroflexota bacterium]|nr:glycosyltransferase family 2 protein [Chloroflexota bacterium]
MPGISVVLPAYNEEANVGQAVRRAIQAVAAHTSDYEVIIVDDGSRDRTSEVVQEIMEEHPQVRLVRHEVNRGYGGALRSGFKAASKDLIFLTASDNQYDPSEIGRLLPFMEDADIVAGFRAHRRDPFLRRVYAWAWNALVNLLFGYLSRDVDCAFKLFRREVLEEVTLTSPGAMVDTQLLAGAKLKGFRIREAAVSHFPREAGHQTGADPRVVLQAFRDLIRYWWELGRR